MKKEGTTMDLPVNWWLEESIASAIRTARQEAYEDAAQIVSSELASSYFVDASLRAQRAIRARAKEVRK